MSRYFPPLLLIVLIALPQFVSDPYLLNALIAGGIFTIGAISLNLLLGFTGQLSLGHIAFFGIGAYASALTSLGFDVGLFGDVRVVHEGWPPLVGFLVAVVLAGACGFIVGRLSFRVRGAYFVIVTIAFAEVVRLVALNWIELTQGPLALTSIPQMRLGLPFIGETVLRTKTDNFYLMLGVATLCYVIVARLISGRFGRAMRGLKENEPLAMSVGINVTRTLTITATISAAMAGAAGSLYAHYFRIIDPDVFLFTYTVTMIIMVVSGGKGTLAGPLIGGVIFSILPVTLRPYMAPEAQWIVYGAVLILILFLTPKGLAPYVDEWFARRRARPAPQHSPALEARAEARP
jgi:branched-chain amino acid transport system permease protein